LYWLPEAGSEPSIVRVRHRVGVRGDQDRRNDYATTHKMLLKLHSIHVRHLQIDNQTFGDIRLQRGEKAGQRLLDDRMLNVVLVLVFTTSLLGPVLTERFASRVKVMSGRS
jgi:hypothetical protein